MKFTVDPWDPSYGASVATELSDPTAPATTDIERADPDWAPVARRASSETTDVLFVDGVRRIEARAWIDGGVEPVPGVFASWAAGAVWCNGSARVVEVEIGRGVFGPTATVADVNTKHGRFLATATENARPETFNTAINRRMTECEARIAERTRRASSELVVLDGPLREATRALAHAVGLVKSHETKYLPVELDRVVTALRPGERTPVFRIEARFRRYSWYLRLPGPAGGPWSGIVRCEAADQLTAPDVVALADQIAATLPGYASEPHKDPRAPQNLYPIAGLERALRRHLGDQRILYRALRTASAPVSVG